MTFEKFVARFEKHSSKVSFYYTAVVLNNHGHFYRIRFDIFLCNKCFSSLSLSAEDLVINFRWRFIGKHLFARRKN